MTLPPRQYYHSLNFNGVPEVINRPWIMAILNTTPDSFFSTSRVESTADIVRRAEELLDLGADIIDIGGQSTRPGAEYVPAEQEIRRVIPAIEILMKELPGIRLSIDTFYSSVAKAAVEAGAGMVNDVSAGQRDPEMFATVSTLQVPYVLMHVSGDGENLHQKGIYDNITMAAIKKLSHQLNKLRMLGMNDIIADPGFGFGKTREENFRLLAELREFEALQVPLLIGISRKSMIWKSISANADEALNGTTALHMAALLNGGNILRVHDVKAAREVCLLFRQLAPWHKNSLSIPSL